VEDQAVSDQVVVLDDLALLITAVLGNEAFAAEESPFEKAVELLAFGGGWLRVKFCRPAAGTPTRGIRASFDLRKSPYRPKPSTSTNRVRQRIRILKTVSPFGSTSKVPPSSCARPAKTALSSTRPNSSLLNIRLVSAERLS
jgi:hypothetical protein